MKFSDALKVLVALAALSAWASAQEQAVQKHPYSFVFDQKCAACHGLDGRGRPSIYRKLNLKQGALDLTRAEVSRSSPLELERTIRLGKGKMPAFQKKFHDDVIVGLARYVKTLPERSENAGGSTPSKNDRLTKAPKP